MCFKHRIPVSLLTWMYTRQFPGQIWPINLSWKSVNMAIFLSHIRKYCNLPSRADVSGTKLVSGFLPAFDEDDLLWSFTHLTSSILPSYCQRQVLPWSVCEPGVCILQCYRSFSWSIPPLSSTCSVLARLLLPLINRDLARVIVSPSLTGTPLKSCLSIIYRPPV